jgi:hypothetical protein
MQFAFPHCFLYINPRARTTIFGEMWSQTRSLADHSSQERVEFGAKVALIGKNDPH